LKIVLDTNVLVSGALSPDGPPGRILALAADRKITVCVDMRIDQEYREVLFRPKLKLSKNNTSALLDNLLKNALWVHSEPMEIELPDQDDRIFMEVAYAALADALVTGNERHFPLHARRNVPLFSPADFISYYTKNR
jgi:uncharacterized protein